MSDSPTIQEEGSGQGPPPCQEPDCTTEATAESNYTYCGEHGDTEGGVESEGEPDVAEVDLSDDDMSGRGDLFSGIEDAEDIDDETGDTGGGKNPLDALDGRGEKMESAVNEGAARLAVVGLDGEEADDLEAELQDVFEAFRLGYFGADFFEEYILVGPEEDIDPAWGLAGSAMCCLAVVLWMRPDGDEQLARVRDAASNLSGGSA